MIPSRVSEHFVVSISPGVMFSYQFPVCVLHYLSWLRRELLYNGCMLQKLWKVCLDTLEVLQLTKF